MRNKRLVLLGLLVLALAVGTAVFAASPAGGFAIPWWTADSGTCPSSGGQFRLAGTVGQPDAGLSSGASYSLYGGFLGAGGGAPCTLRTHLAITIH